MSGLEKQAAALMDQFTPQATSYTLWAYASWGCSPGLVLCLG